MKTIKNQLHYLYLISKRERIFQYTPPSDNTVVRDFNGHEVNGIHGLHGKKCYDKALYLVNNRHDFKGMHDFKGNFPYDDFFR